MGEAARRIATYADIEALPPHVVGEIVDGELHTMSRPSPNNLNAQSCLLSWTNGRFQMGNGGPGGWWIMLEPELHLGADVCVPDIAGWKKERMPRLPKSSHLSVAPDWVCEVISPSTATYDRIKKMSLYARKGVAHAWLVDPLQRSLEAFRLANGQWIWIAACADDERVRVAPFEEVELCLADLWAAVDDSV